MKVPWTSWKRIKSYGQVSGCISKFSLPESSITSQGIILNHSNVKKTNAIKITQKCKKGNLPVYPRLRWLGAISPFYAKIWFSQHVFLMLHTVKRFVNRFKVGYERRRRRKVELAFSWFSENSFLCPHRVQLKCILLSPKLCLNCSIYVTKPWWYLFKAVRGANAVAIQKWSHGYKSAFSENWQCGKSYLFSCNYFRIQFAR